MNVGYWTARNVGCIDMVLSVKHFIYHYLRIIIKGCLFVYIKLESFDRSRSISPGTQSRYVGRYDQGILMWWKGRKEYCSCFRRCWSKLNQSVVFRQSDEQTNSIHYYSESPGIPRRTLQRTPKNYIKSICHWFENINLDHQLLVIRKLRICTYFCI